MIDMHPHFAYELARQHGDDLHRRHPAHRRPWHLRRQPARQPVPQQALRLVGSPPSHRLARATDEAGDDPRVWRVA